MKKIILPVFVIILAFGMLAMTSCECNTEDNGGTDNGPNGSTNGATVFQPELKYATTFNIETLESGCRLVTDGEEQQFLLIPVGCTDPGGYAGIPRISTPIDDVVLLSTTYGALLRPFDVFDSIIGVNTIVENWYVDEVVQGMNNGSIAYVGGGSEMTLPNYEEIQVLGPDLVIMYIYTPDDYSTYETLTGLGLNVLVANDFAEEHYLGKVEMIKLLATFYGKDEAADTYFNDLETNINNIITAATAAVDKPDVLWGSIFFGTAYVPKGGSHVSTMVTGAGGNYLFSDLEGSGSAALSMEEIYARGVGADIFIYSSSPPYINSIGEILTEAPVLADLSPVMAGEVWAFQPWYYQILDKTDEVIADLAAIIHPELFSNHSIQHYLQLPLE